VGTVLSALEKRANSKPYPDPRGLKKRLHLEDPPTDLVGVSGKKSVVGGQPL
jgi:hypothetical protein